MSRARTVKLKKSNRQATFCLMDLIELIVLPSGRPDQSDGYMLLHAIGICVTTSSDAKLT